MNPLLAAASGGRTDVVQLLLRSGAAIDHTDTCGRSALFLAAEIGDLDTVRVLLSAGADVTVREKGGATVLHAAAAAGDVGVMELCLERGLSVSATDEVNVRCDSFRDTSSVDTYTIWVIRCRLFPRRCIGYPLGPQRHPRAPCWTVARR